MDIYQGKKTTAQKALETVRSGQRVLIGSGAAEPQRLVEALAARSAELADVEVLHLLTLGSAPYAETKFKGHLRHNALFIGANVRGAVAQGLADYTPCFLSEVPSLIRSGRIPVDAALISVAPPEGGFCSLGVSVDILKAAIETAGTVVAQVNARMPWSEGDTRVLVEDIDAFVESDQPLPELPRPEYTAASLWIGRYVSSLIEDGSTLQIGIGAIPNAVLAALSGKKDLGIHSEMVSDGILPLIEKGVITGKAKSLHRGKIVASFCMGTRRLYDTVDHNPLFEFHPCDYVNNPMIIARNDRMAAVNSALQVDLTGQVAADSLAHRFHSGVGGQVDFMRGASMSPGGRSIIAMPSTAKNGTVSRIVVALAEGTGVVSTRADVDFVVTEYGIASLKGKTIADRAVALISVAHPDYRRQLLDAAKRVRYLDAGYSLPPYSGPYAVELEVKIAFKNQDVFFRPIKPSDERRLKEMFYGQSAKTTYLRFGIPLKRLSERQFQQMVAIDFRSSMAIAGFVKEDGGEKMMAVARYYADSKDEIAEAAFTVLDRYQGRGIGTFLLDYLVYIGKERGLKGFRAEVMDVNAPMRRVLEKCFKKLKERDLGPDGVSLTALFSDWKGKGNPALGRQAAASSRMR